MTKPTMTTITKLDAGRRQLATAIDLWFHDKDEIAIHTLAAAAYEVIHDATKHYGRTQDLIFDAIVVKDEFRKEFNAALKMPANFFKHADRDPNGTIDFIPYLAEQFMIFAIVGIGAINLPLNVYESTFMKWFCFQNYDLLTDEGKKIFSVGIPVDVLSEIQSLSKVEFFEIWLKS